MLPFEASGSLHLGGIDIFRLTDRHVPDVQRILLEQDSSSFYGLTKRTFVAELGAHIETEPEYNFGISLEGRLVGFLLGGVTLRGALHHLWTEPGEFRKTIARLLIEHYLSALAQKGGVRRTNLVYQTGSYLEEIWPMLAHELPQGEGLVFADLAAKLNAPTRPMPCGYEIRLLREPDDIFGFWLGENDHVSESVLDWETPLFERMLNSGASMVATFEEKIVGGLCAIISWRTASINHLKVDPIHRHHGIWRHLLHESFVRLREKGVLCAHGTVEHPAAFTKKSSFRYAPEQWTFAQGDLDKRGVPYRIG